MIKVAICTILTLCSAASAQLTTKTFGTGENQFSIEFVAIGNPGNQADTTRPGGIGSVNYNYNIAKTEVSRGMLEKANALANLGIYYRDWGNSIRNDPDRAAVDMNWYMAASFVNYLNTSTGNQAAYKFTSSGFQLWSESDPGYNPNNRFRNCLAKYVLPSRDEWYKAAYGSPNGAWYKYSNGSNTEPESVYEGTSGIVYGKLDQWGGPWQTLAKVYEAGALSPFGTMGQGGNAMEWTESEADGVNSSTQNMDANREVLGGGIGNNADGISSTALSTPYPDYGYSFGFRVAMLPDPPAVSFPYSNLLNNPNTVAQDFYDYSQLLSQMMNYDSGNYSVSNNRLEFTTASSWVGVKTLKTQLGFSSGWSAEVDFHLSPLNNVINGHWYDTGISLSMGNDLFSAFPNRINLKAVQSGEGRKIAASFFSDNTERRGLENTTALATATDGTLKMVYNPNDKTINCLFRLSGDTVFTSLGIIDLDQSPGWVVSTTSAFNISLFAGSEPFQTVPSFPTIQSGDMYLTNFKVIPGDWLYTITNNQATITEYVGSGGVATIPSQIDGAPVTKIGNGELPVFGRYNSSVTSLTIPNSVTSIGDYAFQFFSGLTSVTIPNSVTSIGTQAFQACRALTSMTIPNSVTSIGEGAFNSCSSLANLTIGNSVTSIRRHTFWGCVRLTTLAIGDSVTSIGGGAFSYCASLTSLNIPNSVTSIGSSAFQYCYGLTSLTIPDNVTRIEDWAFSDCYGITNLTIGNNVTSIGSEAFRNGYGLTTLTIPNSLNSIGEDAFQSCTNLTKVLFLGDAPVANNSSFGAPTTIYFLCGASGWGGTFAGRPTQEVTAKDIIQAPDIVGLYSNEQYSARYEAGQQSVIASPNSYSLYTANQIQALAFGDLVLSKNANGSFTLNYDIEQSTDLQNWSTYAPLSTPLTGLPADKAFVRIKAKQ